MEFSEQELKKIQDLKIRLGSELSVEQQENHFLIRWLRARQMDVNKAEEMLRKSLEWRKENDMDNILETFTVPEEVLRGIPFAYLGTDPNSGCPVFLFLLGRYDTKKFLDELGQDKVLRQHMYFMEYIHKVIFKDCSEKAGRPITHFIEIVDADFYSYRQLASSLVRDTVTKMQGMFDANYPEAIRHVSLVNAPKVFYIMYNLIKPFIAKETLAKVDIYGPTNWKEEISKRFPIELIPPHWGGTRIGSDKYCSDDPMWIWGYRIQDMDLIKVKARDKVHLEYDVFEEGSTLIWNFKSENHDISFGILHEETEILPLARVDAHKEIQKGELLCIKTGKYVIVFDNSYSYTKGKYVHHRIQIQSPQALNN